MAIRATTGKPGSAKTFTACTPPAINFEAPGASGAKDGQGVCIPETLSRIRPPGRLFSPAECEAIAHRAAGIPRSTPPVENSNPEKLSEADALSQALSLWIQCQFGHSDCPNTPVCDCPALSTPPVENSKAPGGPGVEDGQGVCAYRLHFSWPALDKHSGDLESIDVGPESYAAQWVELALKRGATVVSVERL